MNLPVNLDDQPCRRAVEIRDIRTDGILPPEANAGGRTSEQLPEQGLGRRHLPPQSARSPHRFGSCSHWRRWPLHHAVFAAWFPSPLLRNREERSQACSSSSLPAQLVGRGTVRRSGGWARVQASAASTPISLGKNPSCAARRAARVTSPADFHLMDEPPVNPMR